jgi:RNA polymerase sigma-70 factor (ECF subfamily)
MIAGRSPQSTEIVDLRRRGMTFEEIAERTGLHERTVRRVIEAIRQRLLLFSPMFMEAKKWR